jgi:hypothetical protein
MTQGNGMVRTIVVIKHLGTKVKRPKALLSLQEIMVFFIGNFGKKNPHMVFLPPCST